MDGFTGAKAPNVGVALAALKGRSSTVLNRFLRPPKGPSSIVLKGRSSTA